MEPTNNNSTWDSPDAPSAGVERNLRLQNVATQLQLLLTKNQKNDKKRREEITIDNDAD